VTAKTNIGLKSDWNLFIIRKSSPKITLIWTS